MASAGTSLPPFGATPDSHLREEKISSQELLRGHFLHAFRDIVRLPDGREASREYVRHPGAVMIIAQLDDGRLVLERQYRYPVQSVMIEFPAGKLDAGEAPLDCAKRELLEETGYSAASWVRAGVMHPVISYSTEFIDIWFAKDLSAGERKLDAGEFLDVFTASLAMVSRRAGDRRQDSHWRPLVAERTVGGVDAGLAGWHEPQPHAIICP